jgi:hypothetical protein
MIPAIDRAGKRIRLPWLIAILLSFTLDLEQATRKRRSRTMSAIAYLNN